MQYLHIHVCIISEYDKLESNRYTELQKFIAYKHTHILNDFIQNVKTIQVYRNSSRSLYSSLHMSFCVVHKLLTVTGYSVACTRQFSQHKNHILHLPVFS